MKIEFLTDRNYEGSVAVEAGPFKKWLKINHPEVEVVTPQDATIYDLHDYSFIMPLVNLVSDMSLPNYLALVVQYLETYRSGRLEGESDEVQISAFYQDGTTTKEFNFKGSTDALKASMKKFDLNKFMENP
ncbi:hypothetical protein [Pseudomonas aeruginosa]|uniref:hypothetical protein n=1 Tax=Pseudomonas aeruginosa TaxID=287 RepID=UPI00053E00DC|nr:hypothetical protein [Pseudomonas aeruginosa]ELI9047162.1 hypothetical protein [Pseudomonas aeruginosa]MCS8371766.1 hypothetical protein [Pseudomonas aeruginosa]HBO4439358.1 hypothetical protein [Pseudomonas aeruginosa]HBP1793690.1 hypothetical protein [Pseudomonas aeruginosa]HCF9552116.1 hypothetical protein [Pseudomonas aeruginosa]